MRFRVLGVLPCAFAVVLGLGAASARAGSDTWLAVGDPARPLLFDPRLVVQVRRIPPIADEPRAEAPASTWRTAGPGVLARDVAGDGWRAVLRASPDPRGVSLEVEIHYDAPVVVGREAIRFTLPGRARALGRDLRVAPLSRALRVDRGTPVWLATAPGPRQPGAAIVVEQGVPAARFAPRGGSTDVELVIDDPAVHPFTPFAACRTVYLPHLPGEPAPRRPAPELERRVRRDRIERAGGDVVRARVRLYLLADGEEFLPLVVERWAAGARAAVVFTDHADRTDPEALRALLYGASDRRPAGEHGFFGHHLKLTKTFFLSPGLGSLEDPDARALAADIAARGGEIGSHSITPGRDLRPVVAESLPSFAPWGVVTWIDHQPDTNCEAISSRGWRADPTYGIHDLLVDAGFRWVWGASDGPSRELRVRNLFEPEHPGAALPPIYPLPTDPRLWMFESTWFYGPIARMAAAFSDDELDRLEHERGLFVAHTYLSASPRTTKRRDLIGRDAVLPLPEGGFTLEPSFEDALARLGRRVERGSIASLTLRESSDRLRALDEVSIRYPGDGSAVVSNAGDRPIHGLTVAIPAEAELEVHGAHRAGAGAEPGRSNVWFDLPARSSVVVRARHTELGVGPASIAPASTSQAPTPPAAAPAPAAPVTGSDSTTTASPSSGPP